MELAELPSFPGAPELLVAQAGKTRGLDLLGLRTAAETIAIAQMNGVTTITPLVRYVGLRAWIILAHAARGGPDDARALARFAGKVEAAIAAASALAADPPNGIVGSSFVARVFDADGNARLRPLTKYPAIDAYSGPSRELGVSWDRDEIPGLTKERGQGLAAQVAEVLNESEALAGIDWTETEHAVSRGALQSLGAAFPMARPVGAERQTLIDSVLPPAPRPGELPRLATYTLLLHLGRALGRPPKEPDIFQAVIDFDQGGIPGVTAGVCDGWLRFVTRDLLVAACERAVGEVLTILGQQPGLIARRDRLQRSIEGMPLEDGLRALGIDNLNPSAPIEAVRRSVLASLGEPLQRNGLRRWPGSPQEPVLFEVLADDALPLGARLAAIPIAWLIAHHRSQPGLEVALAGADLEHAAGVARLGLRAVVAPEVLSWERSNERFSSVVARLAMRCVDQHLRIAWSRLAYDPTRDVAVIGSDGVELTLEGSLRPGRATSRLYQAVNWLAQLGLLDAQGITSDGASIFERSVAALTKAGSAA